MTKRKKHTRIKKKIDFDRSKKNYYRVSYANLILFFFFLSIKIRKETHARFILNCSHYFFFFFFFLSLVLFLFFFFFFPLGQRNI